MDEAYRYDLVVNLSMDEAVAMQNALLEHLTDAQASVREAREADDPLVLQTAQHHEDVAAALYARIEEDMSGWKVVV